MPRYSASAETESFVEQLVGNINSETFRTKRIYCGRFMGNIQKL